VRDARRGGRRSRWRGLRTCFGTAHGVSPAFIALQP
jgi:hypothetical protein